MTQKQHYVPEFMLRQWSDAEGNIAYANYIPQKFKILWFKRDVSSFCYNKDFWTINYPNIFPQSVEDYFGRIDNLSSELFFKIKTNQYYRMCESDIGTVSKFILSLMCRNPNFFEIRQNLANRATENVLIQYGAEAGADEIEAISLLTMETFSENKEWINKLSKRKWNIVRIKKDEIILSDYPVIRTYNEKKKRSHDNNWDYTLPITPNIFISTIDIKRISGRFFVQFLNEKLAKQSMKYIFSSQKLSDEINIIIERAVRERVTPLTLESSVWPLRLVL